MIKRIEEGAACIDVFAKMVQERATLERKASISNHSAYAVQHANSLLDWAKRWDVRLEKAPTFKVL